MYGLWDMCKGMSRRNHRSGENKAAILTDLCVECGICAFVCPFVSIVNELPNGGYETGNIMHLSKR